MKKKLLSFLIGAGVLIAGVAYALPYQGFQGGTSYGTGNNPATTTVGQALVVASTSPFLTWTLSPLSTSSGLASYNVSSTNSYISVSTTTTSASLTFSTSSFGSNAFSSVAYYPNSNPSSFIALTALSGTAPITYNNGTGAIGLSTPLASNYGGTATTTALGTAAFTASSSYLPSASSTYFPSVATTSKTIYDNAPTAGDNIPFNIDMQGAVTLKSVECVASSTSDTFTFNIYWGTTRNSTTNKAFTSDQTCTSITTPTVLTPNTTAIAAGSVIRLSITSASSTEATVQIEY